MAEFIFGGIVGSVVMFMLFFLPLKWTFDENAQLEDKYLSTDHILGRRQKELASANATLADVAAKVAELHKLLNDDDED